MLQHETRTELIVNGRRTSTAAQTIAELLAEQDLSAIKVATALNGRFVPEAQRATTTVSAGDRVEVLSARQGG